MTITFFRAVARTACTLLTCSLPLAAQSDPAKPDPATAKIAAPSKEGRAALKSCKELAARAKGKKGADRSTALSSAAQAYQDLAAKTGMDPATRAQASFEAATLWRRGADLAKARPLFQQSRQLDPGRYAARAGLEIAHLDRRSKAHEAALKGYAAVAAVQPSSARAHQARLWLGRLRLQMGDQAAAVKAFASAVAAAGTPRQKIDACNRLANLQVKLGKLAAAAATLATAQQASKAELAGKESQVTRQREALEKAYAKMSAHRALRKARDKANAATRDAEQLQGRDPGQQR